MRTPTCPSSWNARMRWRGMPRPTWMSGDVTSIPSLTRSGRPSVSFASRAPAGRTCTALRVSSETPMLLGRLDVGTTHLCGRAATEERQRVLRLLAQNLEHLLDALRPAESKPVHHRAPDENRASAERECHRDVGAAAHAAVEVDLRAVGDYGDDLRKRLERRDRSVELAPTVIRHDDPRGSVL